MPDDEGQPTVEEMRLGPVLAAPADPLRRRVVHEAGLIRQVARGNSRMATLRRADLEQPFPGLVRVVAAEPEE
ncbi:hypothetical protein ACFQ7F_35320 [Streptomyces sp. NPDC056486]|uniref:hypothetical protein n=1 Tax=Streptomyces sp. NPDC056486 TaxID=3345835 RepID=UPI0036BD293F